AVVYRTGVSHAPADLVAARVGEQDVQQQHVRPAALEQGDRVGCTARGQHDIVVGTQVLGQKVEDVGLVIDDEHGGLSHGCWLLWLRPAAARIGASPALVMWLVPAATEPRRSI